MVVDHDDVEAGAAVGPSDEDAVPDVDTDAVDGAPDDGRSTGDASRDEDVVDELPADLNVAEFDGDYLLPNNNRRRIPATLYLVIAAACAVLWATLRDDSPLVNDGYLWVAVLLGCFGCFGMYAGRTLRIDETEALVTATAVVGFAVGHASAQMVWRGWASRPVWRILMYSAENPPRQRALAVVDGLDGQVVEWFAEANPEDWAGEQLRPMGGESSASDDIDGSDAVAEDTDVGDDAG